MSALDRATRTWWRAVGRRVDVAGAHAWLRAPTSTGPRVADGWLAEEARALDGRIRPQSADAGLVADLGALDGPGFSAAELAEPVRDFYEHTSSWRMEAWTGWAPLFWPGGEIVSRLFGKRVGQLALPTRPLEVAHGIDSRVVVLEDAEGHQRAAGWLRTLRSNGDFLFSGCYSTRTLPGADRPSVHVAFPLEAGNVQVFLRPENGADGSLWLRSPSGSFGDDGAYVVVEQAGGTYAARVPIHETFHVHLDADGVLRTDHELRLWRAEVVRLHYRLEPVTAPA